MDGTPTFALMDKNMNEKNGFMDGCFMDGWIYGWMDACLNIILF